MAVKVPIISTREQRRPFNANGAQGKPTGNGHVAGSLLHNLLPPALAQDERMIVQHIREGRFQRSLSLITAFSSLFSGTGCLVPVLCSGAIVKEG